MIEEKKTVSANLAVMGSPLFLSLVSLPANETGFKIVRSDSPVQKENEMTDNVTTPAVKRRTRAVRADTPLIAIVFPEDMDSDGCSSMMDEFGLSDYTLVCDADNANCQAVRSDKMNVKRDDARIVNLGNGVQAVIQRTEKTPLVNSGVTVVSLELDKQVFTSDTAITDYLIRNDVDYQEEGIQNAELCTTVKRGDLPENAETRKIQVENGVIANVIRSDIMDIPPGMFEVVSESAYGYYGWGMLDFNAYIANETFSDDAWDAIDTLEDVLQSIVLYSSLPIQSRKDLVTRALAQFAVYINGMMDALPREVMMIARKDKKETTMSTATTTTAAPAAPATPAADNSAVSRSDLEAIVAKSVQEGVTAALAARTDTPAPVATPATPATAAPVTEITVVDALRSEIKTLNERLEKMESTTVVRSDTVGQEKPAVRKDVFSGVFSRKQ